MENVKSSAAKKKTTPPTSAKLTQRPWQWAFVGLLALALIWIAMAQIQRQIAIHQQQQRFDVAQQKIAQFGTGIREALGPSLTDIKENDICFHSEQNDFDNGKLRCEVQVEGAANELNVSYTEVLGATRDDSPYALTSTKITNLIQTVLPVSDYPYANSEDYLTPLRNGGVSGDITQILFEDVSNPMICTLHIEGPVIQPFDAVVHVSDKQVFFSLACDQRTSKAFFPDKGLTGSIF